MRVGRCTLLGLLALGACAVKPPPVPEAPPGPPPGTEGRYRGTARLVQAHDRSCPRSGPRTYDLQNGTVTLAYSQGRRRIQLSAPVQADGTFNTSDGVGTLEGQLRNGTLEITIASSTCEHRWTMTHVPGF